MSFISVNKISSGYKCCFLFTFVYKTEKTFLVTIIFPAVSEVGLGAKIRGQRFMPLKRDGGSHPYFITLFFLFGNLGKL